MSYSVDNKFLSESESRSFYIIRLFAVISVIAAHVNSLVKDTGIFNLAITGFWMVFAKCGVVTFFILSGFFYLRIPSDTKKFWKNKLFSIVIPWIICATTTYILSFLLTKRISVLGYFKWVLGSGSWYYYLTVMIILFALFKLIGTSDIVLYICIGLNVASLTLMTAGINYLANLNFITNYLNPLNWIGFFAMGILLRKYRIDRSVLSKKPTFWFALMFFILGMVINIKFEIYSYFNVFSLVIELSAFVVLLYISKTIASKKIGEAAALIGKNTFFIYLTHMQIVQIVSSRIPNNTVKYLLNPIVEAVLMIVITMAIRFVFNHIPKGNKLIKFVGIR